MEAVTDVYLNPPQGIEDDIGHMRLKQLAEKFFVTLLKMINCCNWLIAYVIR